MENRAAYLSKQKSDTPPPPPKYSMLKHFDVIQKVVPSKAHFNNKKHYKWKNAILKQKNHYFLNFPKPVPWQHDLSHGHGNYIKMFQDKV